MARRSTQEAIAEAAPLDVARAAAGSPREEDAERHDEPTSGRGAGAGAGAGAGSGDLLTAELRRGGLLPLLVLHFCGREPSYGGKLMERVTAATGGLVAVNPNTMYPLLRKLESQGLVQGEWEHPERRSRRFYALTDAGREERDRLAEDLAPRLDAVATAVETLRAELA